MSISRHISTSSFREDVPVAFEQRSRMRKFVLKRGEKLNSLSEPMIDLLRTQIQEWKNSDLCHVIVGTAEYSGPKVFCSGGDIGAVAKLASDPSTQKQAVLYFKKEYELDLLLASLLKPYVAVMDGITMGGGVGLVAPASFRIATENTRFAMPETNIGFFPDVGATFYLNRLDGYLGTFLGLTGTSLFGRDVFELGFATHYIPSGRLPAIYEQLEEATDSNDVDDILNSFSGEREPEDKPPLLTGKVRVALDDAFSKNSVEEILSRLQFWSTQEGVSEWAAQTIKDLNSRSPTSLKVALRAIRMGAACPLKEAFNVEMLLAESFCRGQTPDFQHGVTQALSKSRELRDSRSWSPAKLEDVSGPFVKTFFYQRKGRTSLDHSWVDVDEFENEEVSETDEERGGYDQLVDPIVPYEKDKSFNDYTLPTEREIEAVVRGSHPSSGSTGMRKEEVVDRFVNLKQRKVGVKDKVLEVLERQCDLVDNGDGEAVWLEWAGHQDDE
ncbi:3-hydroxyisobutyryl-coenzyme A hydrolase isoform 1 [Flagelloscypha sp. PMI_526]|nr:3-hydroxyisobutyryl-coenzyme A hydrolase isoform 1 [Flagelloscypha sp. PMI_526]